MIDPDKITDGLSSNFFKWADNNDVLEGIAVDISDEYVSSKFPTKAMKDGTTAPNLIRNWSFLDLVDGKEFVLTNGSFAIYRAFQENPYRTGDHVRITRSGMGGNTVYKIEVIKPAAKTSVSPVTPLPAKVADTGASKDEINIDDIPF